MRTNEKLKKLKTDFKYHNDLISKTEEPRSHLLLAPIEQIIEIILDEMKGEVLNPNVEYMERLIKMLSRFVALKKKYFKNA